MHLIFPHAYRLTSDSRVFYMYKVVTFLVGKFVSVLRIRFSGESDQPSDETVPMNLF